MGARRWEGKVELALPPLGMDKILDVWRLFSIYVFIVEEGACSSSKYLCGRPCQILKRMGARSANHGTHHSTTSTLSQHHPHIIRALSPLSLSTTSTLSHHHLHLITALHPPHLSTTSISSQHHLHLITALPPPHLSTTSISSQHHPHIIRVPPPPFVSTTYTSSQHHIHVISAPPPPHLSITRTSVEHHLHDRHNSVTLNSVVG